MPEWDSELDLVVVNYHTDHDLQTFLESCERFEPDRRVIVVDVESDGEDRVEGNVTFKHLAENVGYARACNYGSRFTKAKNIGFFNADTRFINPDALDICLKYLSEDGVGIVGPRQLDSHGKVTHGGIFGTNDKPVMRGWQQHGPAGLTDVSDAIMVSGSAILVKRKMWKELYDCPAFSYNYPQAVGAFLPTAHYYEETYLCYHAREHKWLVKYVGEAEMVHEWHQASPVGSATDMSVLQASRDMFRQACDLHGIHHD